MCCYGQCFRSRTIALCSDSLSRVDSFRHIRHPCHDCRRRIPRCLLPDRHHKLRFQSTCHELQRAAHQIFGTLDRIPTNHPDSAADTSSHTAPCNRCCNHPAFPRPLPTLAAPDHTPRHRSRPRRRKRKQDTMHVHIHTHKLDTLCRRNHSESRSAGHAGMWNRVL